MNDYGTRFALGCVILLAVGFFGLAFAMWCIQEYAKR
jgi:hypothetical protein